MMNMLSVRIDEPNLNRFSYQLTFNTKMPNYQESLSVTLPLPLQTYSKVYSDWFVERVKFDWKLGTVDIFLIGGDQSFYLCVCWKK